MTSTSRTQTTLRDAEHESPGAALTRLLKADERSLSWLSRRIPWSVSHLYRVSTGERPFTRDLAEALAELFSVPIETFLAGEAS